MKVYFHASVTHKDKYGVYYERIVRKLEAMGFDVCAPHPISHKLDWLYRRDAEDDLYKDYDKMFSRVKAADLVVCEISFPSTIVVGHVLTRALHLGKPLLGLYHEDTTAALLRGLELERFRVAKYSSRDLEEILSFEITELQQMPDQRFTMLLQGDIAEHLNQVALEGGNKSEYIRGLIRREMKAGEN